MCRWSTHENKQGFQSLTSVAIITGVAVVTPADNISDECAVDCKVSGDDSLLVSAENQFPGYHGLQIISYG